jgi:hypothetical protein
MSALRSKVDDSLSQLFRSETPEFRTFEELTRCFPSNEFDVVIVVEGSGVGRRPLDPAAYGYVFGQACTAGRRQIALPIIVLTILRWKSCGGTNAYSAAWRKFAS